MYTDSIHIAWNYDAVYCSVDFKFKLKTYLLNYFKEKFSVAF